MGESSRFDARRELPHPLEQLLRQRRLAIRAVVKGDDSAGAFGDDGALAAADDAMLEHESIRLDGLHPGPDGDGVGIRQSAAKARLRRGEDGADAGLLAAVVPAAAAKELEAGVFEVTEVDDVVDVLVRVHLAPDDILHDDDGKAGEMGGVKG